MDHYQLRRVIDVFDAPLGEELGSVGKEVNRIVGQIGKPEGIRVTFRGERGGDEYRVSLVWTGADPSLVLVYLVLVAQFRSFIDPLIILLAVPPGLGGRAGYARRHGDDPQHHVADGRGDDGRDCRLQ